MLLEKIKNTDPRLIKSGFTVAGALLVGVAVFLIKNQFNTLSYPNSLDPVVDAPEPPPFNVD